MLPEPSRPPTRIHQPMPLHGGTVEPFTAAPPAPVPERRIVGYEKYADMLLPVYETVAPVQRTEPRDLTSQPLFDPLAQRMAAGGFLAAGVGVGGWLLFSAIAGAATALAFLAAAILACKLPAAGRGRGSTVHVHQRAGMFGRNHNTNR